MIRNFSQTHLSPFVGRAKELAEIVSRLKDPECRLLTLTGLGGSGKTRLAVEAANAVESHFAQGAVFVCLQPLIKSELLVHTIAQALSLTLYGEDDPEKQLFDYLHEKSLLLLMDNFEHLLSGMGIVSRILAHAPKVKILVTSREALNLQEEWLYPLNGMTIPLSTYATALEDYEAVQLFLYHARRVQPNFNPAVEHDSIVHICEMTAGLPLAIELAASWLKGLTASQIAFQMQHNLDFLATTSRNVEERHRSVRAVFDHSWQLLSEKERLIFARLSVFRGGFDSDEAEQIAQACFADLSALVEKSLVFMMSPDRYGVHELLSQYGGEKLEAYGETEATYARHSQYFAQLMAAYETALKQPHQLKIMRAVESDFQNICLAWDWSAKNQQVANLDMMLNGLYLFGFLGRRHRETIQIFQHTLEQSITNRPLLGRLLARRWGFLHWWYQSDYQEALTSIEQALIIATAENNTFEIAFAHLMAAYAMINLQRDTEALEHLEAAQTLFEAIHEPYYVCWVLHRLGYVYDNLGDAKKGIEFTEQSLALARSKDNRFALVICLYNLGSDYILDRNYVKAKLYGEEALQLSTESGQQCQIAHALSLLALCAFFQGDYVACVAYAERSQAIIAELNTQIIQPYSLSLLIVLACMREDYAEAIRLNELSNQHSTNPTDFQLQYWALAALSCGLGKPEEARLNIQKMFQLFALHIDAITTLWMVPIVAYTLVETDPEKAVELLGWVSEYPGATLNWVREWPLFNRLQTRLHDMMESEMYQMNWEKGQNLTSDDMNSYLQREFRTDPDAETPQRLTARECEILGLMAEGMTNPQIAAQLVIGAGTVKTHTLNIYRKLDVANRTQAIVHAQQLGLLHMASPSMLN